MVPTFARERERGGEGVYRLSMSLGYNLASGGLACFYYGRAAMCSSLIHFLNKFFDKCFQAPYLQVTVDDLVGDELRRIGYPTQRRILVLFQVVA